MAPSFPTGEPITTVEPAPIRDWKAELPLDARSRIVNKIMETLRKHLPFTGQEGMNELQRIASRFEENIFNTAVNQTDYLRKISMKMLTMETKSQNEAGSSSSIPAPTNYATPFVSGLSLPNGEPAMNIGDWRTQLSRGAREENVDKIMEALEEHVPNCGQGRINELMRIATSFEELIFNTAINQADYFRKVSFRMQTIEDGE